MSNIQGTLLELVSELMPQALSTAQEVGSSFPKDLSLSIKRISAFPKFLTSLEELELHIDRATPNQISGYRASFSHLANSLLAAPSCVVYRQGPANPIGQISSELSESSSAALFFPELAVAVIGHDDFGCNLLYINEQSEGYAHMRQLVAASGLCLVSIP